VFFDTPPLRYTNMPATAQGFPTLATLAADTGADLVTCQCSTCGLVQLSNSPVPYYREVIRAAAFSDEMREFRRVQFSQWVKQYGLTGKKILEVGCGRGEYLELLNELQVRAYGVEYGQESVTACRTKQLAVTQAFIDVRDAPLPDGPFAAFTCLNFLEHWPEPNATLQGICRNLADGGIGMVEVPNFDMILKLGLFSEFIADHLLYFTRDTLTFSLQRNGFEVLECEPVWHDYILSAIVRKRSGTDLAFFEDFRANITATLNEYIGRFPAGKVAVWGAGHQALAVIALADIGQHLKYVLDSAPFKQGKYTPSTHVPIVVPDALVSDPVDAVIIMAAAYSDEVARTVRARYPATLHVAILRDHGLEIVP
jgi:SAM-dependent methyltransferase